MVIYIRRLVEVMNRKEAEDYLFNFSTLYSKSVYACRKWDLDWREIYSTDDSHHWKPNVAQETRSIIHPSEFLQICKRNIQQPNPLADCYNLHTKRLLVVCKSNILAPPHGESVLSTRDWGDRRSQENVVFPLHPPRPPEVKWSKMN